MRLNDIPCVLLTQGKSAIRLPVIPGESLRLAMAGSDRTALFSLTPGFSPVHISPDRT
jgi:hypothetical protein